MLLTDSHARVTCLSPMELVQQIVSVLGAPLTAIIGGVRSTRSVRQWMSGEGAPSESKLPKFRAALQIIETLKLRFENDIVRAWFTGMNPHLDDRSPILVIAAEDFDFTAVLQAARLFVSEQ